jgi:hypothetical protein
VHNKPVNGDDAAELVGKLMDALAEELGRLKSKAARREEIVAQISRLSRLYSAIRTDEDLSLQDR